MKKRISGQAVPGDARGQHGQQDGADGAHPDLEHVKGSRGMGRSESQGGPPVETFYDGAGPAEGARPGDQCPLKWITPSLRNL